MRFNPYLNAIYATAYISSIAFLIRHIASLHHDTPDNTIGSIAFISLVVFSTAVMGFLFFYRPIILLIENKKAEAINFFIKTIGTFGLITLIIISTIL